GSGEGTPGRRREEVSTPAPGQTGAGAMQTQPLEETMPLINCSACGREISTEAEACPQCGHPNRPPERAPAGPRCYACSATATTRCQSCGALRVYLRKVPCATRTYGE